MIDMNEMIIPIANWYVVGIIVGFVIAKILAKNSASSVIASAEKEAKLILKEAKKEGESLKKDKLLQAKERFIELKSEHEKVILSKDKKLLK